MKFRNRRIAAVAAVALSASLGLTACGGSDSSSGNDSASGSGGGKVSVTFLPKNLGNPYFDTSDAGGKKAVGEFGGTY
jgi:rhamnose transport system substrate-binding protein